MNAEFIRETSELARAADEIRGALGALGQQESLPACLMSLCTMMDRLEIGLTAIEGESAFEFDEQSLAVYFRAGTIRRIIAKATELADDAGLTNVDERVRAVQVALNLFVLHELLHIEQNFPHHSTVAIVKAGAPRIGLPMLDVAADTAAAWVCARIEADKANCPSAEDMLRFYVNCLIMSYMIGAFIFDVSSKSEKKQRALGLLLSAVLVQAKVDGLLVEEKLYANWKPGSPLLALDLEAAKAFNAIVIDSIPGLLFAASDTLPGDLRSLWDGIGRKPVHETLQQVSEAFMRAGILRRQVAAETPALEDDRVSQARARGA